MKLLIVGNRGGSNIGGSLERAAMEMGIKVEMLESKEAMRAPALVRAVNWHLRGHRPSGLAEFGRKAVEICRRWRPNILISTGLAPLEASALGAIVREGIRVVNYLTDDPWNPAHQSPWFIRALPSYDTVYSVRRANISDLLKAGAPKVEYLPFAYDPYLYHPYDDQAKKSVKIWDAVFVGGADRDRVPYIDVLVKKGIKVGLYGSYWERYAATRNVTQGRADVEMAGKVTAAAKVAICLVRRCNRDDNCMRTFEIPAVGGCPLMEDTVEHREIFGQEGKAAHYFKTADEMRSKVEYLLSNPKEREYLAVSAHQLITAGHHTYRDRLGSMLGAKFSKESVEI